MKEGASGGIGFFSLLGLLFIGLKLTDNIDWSWWWVLAPFWLPAVLTFVFVLAFLALKAWADK
jgi:hypothetical protein